MEPIIRVEGLVKKYGELTAVDGVSFQVRQGDFFAFLGPNGAGKSTTISILCTLLVKTAGSVTVAGFDVDSGGRGVREAIGIVFQDNVLDPLLTVKENLLTRGGLYEKDRKALKFRLDEVTRTIGLGEYLSRPFGKLSGGQKRRAEVARALMSRPKLLILDEPTTGLDPQTRKTVWEVIAKLQKEEKLTVFFTTHYMEEAAGADMVAVIDRGKIVASGTPNELKERYSSDILRLAPRHMGAAERFLSGRGYAFEKTADMLTVRLPTTLEAYGLLKEMEGGFDAFEVIRGTMDDVFVNITGRSIREGD
ncbi:ABC transporter ATP-binding protein [Papillibacter cinnamivorans]|uniref:Multidrug/hemolysin transport system ATP-binding protein n=1 Tax=Papillibacter cinnamivorans DSM 12816 TaxID=1122930 RepID=A0A1W2CKB2_9FIRM|nr:ABC transporter ATP-binding protein [Papillibacter cinnamivorans]SMC85630.1 multidrug/hemolysin transport system ATP-binding protein [Papillibacter cinnamivorans DSM 12816]